MNLRKSIFTRLFIASLLPFTVAFLAMLGLVSHIIQQYSNNRVRETTSFYSVYASERITDTLTHISSLVRLTAHNMEEVADNSDAGRKNLRIMLATLMNANPEIYCAWFVFDQGVASDSPGWFIETYVKKNGDITLAPSESQEQLDDPEYSPWHTVPYQTGQPYQDAVDAWDYGMGDGIEFAGTIAFPIHRNGKIIGTIGIDILYESAFRFLDGWQIPNERKILLLASNGVVLYSEHDEYKRRDYHELGFDPADVQDIDQAMEHGGSLMKEIHSPLTRQRSLVSIIPVTVPNAVHTIFLYLDQPTDILYREERSITRSVLLICLAALLTTAAAVFIASRSIARPVRRLTTFATRVADGDLDIDAEEQRNADLAAPTVHTGDEVDLLRTSIAKMMQQVGMNHKFKLAAVQSEYERKKLEDASREQSQFFANISHEIRTPMNAIMGISDLMLAAPLPDEQRERATDIKSSAQSLLVLINDILDISRIESGRFKLIETDYDFKALLRTVSSVCQYLAGAKHLSFTIVESGSVPQYLYGDEDRVKQVLLNILGNAVKFTEQGGVTLRVDGKDGRLHIDVEDTGCGVKEEDKAALFNAFRQVDQLKHKHVKGTGLGLSISKSLVEMMGGSIWLDSEYGKGSVFHLDLPLVPGNPENAVKEGVDAGEMVMSNARVLIVDDNVINLKVASGLIGMHGVRCDLAKSGAQALKMVQAVPYDIVFMDHMMPEMDGVETTRRIRALDGSFRDIPIIALTANAIAGVKEELLRAGMSDYLSKPIGQRDLNAILRRWLPKNTIVPNNNDASPETAKPHDS